MTDHEIMYSQEPQNLDLTKAPVFVRKIVGRVWVSFFCSPCTHAHFEAAPKVIKWEGEKFILKGQHYDGLLYESVSPAISDLQQIVTEWTRTAFPDATTSSVIARIGQEYMELQDAHAIDPNMLNHDLAVRGEIADLEILLLDYCALKGWSMDEIVRQKLEKVSKLELTPTDEHGQRYTIKTTLEPGEWQTPNGNNLTPTHQGLQDDHYCLPIQVVVEEVGKAQ